jgi:hypothetical protein
MRARLPTRALLLILAVLATGGVTDPAPYTDPDTNQNNNPFCGSCV